MVLLKAHYITYREGGDRTRIFRDLQTRIQHLK